VLAAIGALAAAGSQLEDVRGPGAPAAAPTSAGGGRTLTIAWGSRPRSLDPAFAADRTSANVVWNLMDPLVKLGDDLEPVPNLAKGWSVSVDGRRVTFLLRSGGRWTNGERVTARDFEYAWKRVLSPELGSPFAARLFAIRGARAYHACPARCDRLRRRVGVQARGDLELVVTLSSRQPWFVTQTAHPAFLPVPALVVEQHGKSWTAERNLVTSGPFRLAAFRDDTLTLVKNRRWRNARSVATGRVEGRIVPDAGARLQAFDSGQVMTLDGSPLPATEMPALRERQEFEVYPALVTYLYAFNLATLSDVHQRRAMALAIDRRALVDLVVQSADVPASGLTPATASRLGKPLEPSPWSPVDGDLAAAREELDRAAAVKRRITLLHSDEPGDREIAVAVRSVWGELGIDTTLRSRPADEYLDFRGPLSKDSVDLYAVERRYEYPDPMSGLSPWACRAPENKTNFCNAGFDRLLARARRQLDSLAREQVYREAERILAGAEGRLPAISLFWRASPNLENLSVKQSFSINALGQIDLSAVEFE
jgi:ABC-type oligopeptide transport system substrate-binding subunit